MRIASCNCCEYFDARFEKSHIGGYFSRWQKEFIATASVMLLHWKLFHLLFGLSNWIVRSYDCVHCIPKGWAFWIGIIKKSLTFSEAGSKWHLKTENLIINNILSPRGSEAWSLARFNGILNYQRVAPISALREFLMKTSSDRNNMKSFRSYFRTNMYLETIRKQQNLILFEFKVTEHSREERMKPDWWRKLWINDSWTRSDEK